MVTKPIFAESRFERITRRHRPRLSHRLSLAVFGICSLVAAVVINKPAAAEDFPVVVTTEPLSPAEEQKKFHLPPGFEIQLVAAEPEVIKPINMNFDARGQLYFTQSVEYPFPVKPGVKGRDTVKVIEGIDEHGHATHIRTMVDGLNIPLGVTPIPNGVVVYSTPDIYRCLDPAHTGHVTERKVIYGDFQFHDTHGMNNSFTRGLDGWIYANHGFNNDDEVAGADGKKIHMQSGNTYRMRADGSHLEYFSHGRVNPFGICFDPLDNMYVADCETLPIYLHLRGAYYPSFGKPDDGLGFGPEMLDHMHGSSAIAGIVYYAATQFPAEWRDTMFIGNPVTHRINHDALKVRGSAFWGVGAPDFLVCDDPWCRPVDLKLGPDGAMYMADFYNRIIGHYEVPLTHPGRDHTKGRIWRIVYTGTKDKPVANPTIPNLAEMSAEQSIEQLANPNLTVRTLATHELVDRIGEQAIAPLQKRLQVQGTNPWQRAHGLWVLERLHALTDAEVAGLAADPDRLVRVHLVKALAERPDWSKEKLDLQGMIREKLNDPDAVVRRAAAEALGRHPALENVRPLAELWAKTPGEDRHLIHTTRIALRNQLEVDGMYSALEKAGIPGADRSLRERLADVSLGVATPESGTFLMQTIASQPDLGRLPDFIHHAARYLPEAQIDSLFAALNALENSHVDLSRQRDLLRSAQQGLQERGHAALPAGLRAWSGHLAERLLAAGNEAEKGKGIELARELKITEVYDRLATIVAEPQHAGLRPAAIDACATLEPTRAVALLGDVVGRGAEPLSLRQKGAQALAAINTDASRAELLSRLTSAPERLAVDLAAGLAASRSGGELLLKAIQEGKASARLLREPTVLSRLHGSGIPKLDAQIRELTAGLPPGDNRLEKLIQQRRAGYLKSKPDLALGLQAFKKTCTACHRIGGEGHKVGPDLDGIGVRGLDRVLEDVLDPNRNVDQAFRVTLLQTNGGQSLSGLVLREEGEVVVLADPQGKEVRVAKSDIAERRLSALSPMPANVADLIGEKDFYNLIGFLLTQLPQ
jgi:putative heme-binding domain-containing protein